MFGRDAVVSATDRKLIFHQVAPFGIVGFDQLNFPLAPPILHLSLSIFGLVAGWKFRIPDQAPTFVFARKTRNFTGLMLPRASDNIVGLTNIECAIFHAGRDVDIEDLRILQLPCS